MIFPSYYHAPISYYAVLLNSDQSISIETHDHYSKQTYRNRCRIMGANGVLSLIVPVVKEHGRKTWMKDVRIEYDAPWQRIHWQSIISAYASAPFFEFFEDSYRYIYEKEYTFLADLNMDLLRSTQDVLQLNIHLSDSEEYTPQAQDADLSASIHPKKKFEHRHFLFHPVRYHQVFADRHGFQPDLSILDLLFNEGPNAPGILKRSVSVTIPG